MGAHRIVAGSAAGILLAGLLTACDAVGGGPDGPDPEDAAATLATALGSGEFTEVEFTDETPESTGWGTTRPPSTRAR